MEEHLWWRESVRERGGDEPPCRRAIGAGAGRCREAGERARIRRADPTALRILLPHTNQHLRQVDNGALGAAVDGVPEPSGGGVSGRRERNGPRLRDHFPKTGLHGPFGPRACAVVFDRLLHRVIGPCHGPCHQGAGATEGLVGQEAVLEANTEGVLRKPESQQALRVPKKGDGGVVSD